MGPLSFDTVLAILYLEKKLVQKFQLPTSFKRSLKVAQHLSNLIVYMFLLFVRDLNII